MRGRFDSIYTHQFIRAAVCVPSLRVADPEFNVERTLALARQASAANVAVALFPELGISAYSNEDLFHQDALLDACKAAVERLVKASGELTPVLIVGAPLQFDGKLFNCAVVIYRGRVLGLAPKSYLPNYREFYEKRQFTSGRHAISREVRFLGERVPFGNDLIFEAENVEGFKLHAEICEDVWTPIPPSTYAALAGATILANLSASNITIGKAEYRRDLCAAQSGKCIAAYLYSAAGPGESTTDLAWDGHGLMKRRSSNWLNRVVIGISGGLDSTQALIVAAKTMDRMGVPRKNILAYTMPGFATSDLTRKNAHQLMAALGVTAGEIDIKPA